MATTYKRLGALACNGTVGTGQTVYTAAGGVIVSSIVVCNTGTATATYRLGVSTTTSYEASGYLAYGAAVQPNDSVFITVGVSLDSTNKYLLASASSTAVSISVFGAEVS